MGGCAVVTTPQREDVPYIPALCEAMNVASLHGPREVARWPSYVILRFSPMFLLLKPTGFINPHFHVYLPLRKKRYKDIRFQEVANLNIAQNYISPSCLLRSPLERLFFLIIEQSSSLYNPMIVYN